MPTIDAFAPRASEPGNPVGAPSAPAARRRSLGYRHFNENFIGSWLVNSSVSNAPQTGCKG